MRFFEASGDLRERDMGLGQLKPHIARCSYQDSAVSLFLFLNKQASLVLCLGLIPTPPKRAFWLFFFACVVTVFMEEGISGGPYLTFWECFPFYLLTSYESTRMQCGLFCSTWYLSFHLTLFGCCHSAFLATLFYTCISLCGSVTTFIALSVNTGVFSFGILWRVLLMTIIVQEHEANKQKFLGHLPKSKRAKLWGTWENKCN